MIRIGTNFSYNGRQYLDERQGMADNTQDLLGWDILVPEGFDVFVEGEGKWYTYDSEYNSSETGHFKLRPGFEEYNELANEVFPLTFSSFSGGGNFEIGSQVLPIISWTLSRKGEAVLPISSTVNGSTEYVSENKLSYTHPTNINTDKTFEVVSEIASGASARKTASYKFLLKKYYGVSPKTSLSNDEILSLSSTWATSGSMEETSFDCTGGKYPYYIIPMTLYNPETFKIWIGGLRNTDFTVTYQSVQNSFGYSTSYAVIRLNTLQHGILSIRFSS